MATNPRDVFVGLRFTEAEIDFLYRLSGGSKTLADTVREVIKGYRAMYSIVPRDNESARFARERRKARRAGRTPQPELEAVVGEAISDHAEELL